MPTKLVHLLIPKQFRVWCRPNGGTPTKYDVTTQPTKVTCCNCITAWRRSTGKHGGRFKVAYLNRPEPEREPKNRCVECGRIIHDYTEPTVCDKCYAKYNPDASS